MLQLYSDAETFDSANYDQNSGSMGTPGQSNFSFCKHTEKAVLSDRNRLTSRFITSFLFLADGVLPDVSF